MVVPSSHEKKELMACFQTNAHLMNLASKEEKLGGMINCCENKVTNPTSCKRFLSL